MSLWPKGGGAHSAPLENFHNFRWFIIKFGTEVEQVVMYKLVPLEFLKVAEWGRNSIKYIKKGCILSIFTYGLLKAILYPGM